MEGDVAERCGRGSPSPRTRQPADVDPLAIADAPGGAWRCARRRARSPAARASARAAPAAPPTWSGWWWVSRIAPAAGPLGRGQHRRGLARVDDQRAAVVVGAASRCSCPRRRAGPAGSCMRPRAIGWAAALDAVAWRQVRLSQSAVSPPPDVRDHAPRSRPRQPEPPRCDWFASAGRAGRAGARGERRWRGCWRRGPASCPGLWLGVPGAAAAGNRWPARRWCCAARRMASTATCAAACRCRWPARASVR